MKIIPFAALLVLTSCASSTATPALENRLASWTGSSVHDLAGVLGEPTVVSENSWEWRFTGPGMQATTSTSSVVRQKDVVDRHALPISASSPGIDGENWTKSIDTSVQRKECVYRARVDGATVVEVETLAISGRCRFGEIPLQANN